MDKFLNRKFDSDKSESSENKQLTRSESISWKKKQIFAGYIVTMI